MALKDNLISYWKMEEASSATRVDAHGNNDLSNNGSVVQGTGKIGFGADFERGDAGDYLSITDAAQTGLDLVTDFTINWWVNLETAVGAAGAGQYGLWYKYEGTNVRSLRIYLDRPAAVDNFNMVTSTDGTSGTLVTLTDSLGTTLSTGTLYMITVTYDLSAGTMELFLNGSSLGTTAGGNTTIANTTAPLYIGAEPGNGVYFDGVMDELSVWNRIVTSEEIAEIYNAGAGLGYDDWDAAPATTLRGVIGYGNTIPFSR